MVLRVHCAALSPLMPLACTRGAWSMLVCTRSAQSVIYEQASSPCVQYAPEPFSLLKTGKGFHGTWAACTMGVSALCHGIPLPSLWHTVPYPLRLSPQANPSPLPGADLQGLSLSVQTPLLASQDFSWPVVQMIYAVFTLLFHSQPHF